MPPKIFIFLKIQTNFEIQNFEAQKMARAYVCMKSSENPSPPPPDVSDFEQTNQIAFKVTTENL